MPTFDIECVINTVATLSCYSTLSLTIQHIYMLPEDE